MPIVGARLIDLRHLSFEQPILRSGHFLIRLLQVPLFLLLKSPVHGVAHSDGHIPQRNELSFVLDFHSRGWGARLLHASLCELLVEDASVHDIPIVDTDTPFHRSSASSTFLFRCPTLFSGSFLRRSTMGSAVSRLL